MTENGTVEHDLIIIGAGLSGLVTAFKILKKEPTLRVIILEATDRIGGQIFSTLSGELGAQWIHSDHVHIQSLCQELNFKLIMWKTAAECDIELTILEKYEINLFMWELDVSAVNFKRHNFSRSTDRMQNFIMERLFFEKSQRFMLSLVLLFCGRKASEITCREFFRLCLTRGGFRKHFEFYTGTGSQSLYVPDTTWNDLVQLLVEKIGRNLIFLNMKCTQIHQHSSRFYTVTCDSNKRFNTSAVVLAIPWNEARHVEINAQTAAEKPLKSYSEHLLLSFIAKCNDETPFCVLDPFVMGSFFGKETMQGVLLLKNDSFQQPEIDLSALEQFSTFCDQKSIAVPSTRTYKLWELSVLIERNQFADNLIWSSAGTATCGQGYLNGAVQSGLKAALLTLLAIRPQTIIWQDVCEVEKNFDRNNLRMNWLELWISRLLFKMNIPNLVMSSAVFAITLGCILASKIWN